MTSTVVIYIFLHAFSDGQSRNDVVEEFMSDLCCQITLLYVCVLVERMLVF